MGMEVGPTIGLTLWVEYIRPTLKILTTPGLQSCGPNQPTLTTQ